MLSARTPRSDYRAGDTTSGGRLGALVPPLEDMILQPRRTPRVVVPDAAVDSPRMRSLLSAHPLIHLNDAPPRAHRAPTHFAATLRPYAAPLPEKLDVHPYDYPRLTLSVRSPARPDARAGSEYLIASEHSSAALRPSGVPISTLSRQRTNLPRAH